MGNTSSFLKRFVSGVFNDVGNIAGNISKTLYDGGEEIVSGSADLAQNAGTNGIAVGYNLTKDVVSNVIERGKKVIDDGKSGFNTVKDDVSPLTDKIKSGMSNLKAKAEKMASETNARVQKITNSPKVQRVSDEYEQELKDLKAKYQPKLEEATRNADQHFPGL